MPTIRHRTRAKRSDWPEGMRHYLETGDSTGTQVPTWDGGKKGGGWCERNLPSAWEEMRWEILESWPASSRPWAWWVYEPDEDREAWLRRHPRVRTAREKELRALERERELELEEIGRVLEEAKERERGDSDARQVH